MLFFRERHERVDEVLVFVVCGLLFSVALGQLRVERGTRKDAFRDVQLYLRAVVEEGDQFIGSIDKNRQESVLISIPLQGESPAVDDGTVDRDFGGLVDQDHLRTVLGGVAALDYIFHIFAVAGERSGERQRKREEHHFFHLCRLFLTKIVIIPETPNAFRRNP